MAEETTAPGAAGDDEAAWKQARQRAATSQCYICIDDHPEVMSLCCGIPLHVNCWTGATNSAHASTAKHN